MGSDRTEMVPKSVVIARLEERLSSLQRELEARTKEVTWLRFIVETRVVAPPQQKKEG